MAMNWNILELIPHLWGKTISTKLYQQFNPIIINYQPYQLAEDNWVELFLVGGFKHFLFSIIYGIILPID
jgi:hypothetical protein